LEDGIEVEIMCNEIVDERARRAALNGAVFVIPLPPIDFQGLARSVLVTGRITHSILPRVSL
jgi:hypothetical protein